MTLPVTLFSNPRVASITGTLLQSYQTDVYSFSAAAGNATVSCDVSPNWTPSLPRANLDCQIEIIAPNGVLLAALNPVGTDAPVGLGVGQTVVALPTAGT
jgi:hypothetical protein